MEHTKIKVSYNTNNGGITEDVFISPDNYTGGAIAMIYNNNSSVKNIEDSKEIACRIVKTWNMHDELVEALRNMIDMLPKSPPPIYALEFDNAKKLLKKASE